MVRLWHKLVVIIRLQPVTGEICLLPPSKVIILLNFHDWLFVFKFDESMAGFFSMGSLKRTLLDDYLKENVVST